MSPDYNDGTALLEQTTNGGASWSSAADTTLAACASRPGIMHMATNGQLYIANDANVVCHGHPM